MTEFPAFLKLEYRGDGAATSAFLREVEQTLAPAESRLREFSSEAKRQLDAALSVQRTPTGALDLNVAGQRAAADAARTRATAARELATATATAARENLDFSQTTRLAIVALQSQVREEDQAAAAALSHARALEQVQAVLNRQVGGINAASEATRRAAVANDNFTTTAGQQRIGLQQLGFQIGDIATQFALGARPAQIFAAQAGQVSQALTLMGGTGALGRVGAFLGGPWGIALTVATVALSPFIGKLFETAGAADDVKFATNAMGDANGILGNVLDLTTGKITTQSSALIGLAKAQLLVAQVQARTRAADARRGVADIASRPIELSGGLGGGFSAQRRPKDARDTISASVLGGPIGVSLGVRKKSFRVDTSGRGRTKGAGVLDFGQDQEAAARAAVLNALQDGAIRGLREGAQRLLSSGKDLDRALQKALDFQSVFDRLKAIDNPVGAALDTLDKEFSRLGAIFGEAGASAAEAADLERLYGLERTKTLQAAIDQVGGSLKSLLADLGQNNDALSLRERLGLAQSAYDPLRARVAAGDSSAYSDFSDAARALLDIQRQFSGSQNPYFELLAQVRGLSQSELDRQGALASAATNRDSPLSANPVPSGDNVGVIDAIDRQTQQLLDGLLGPLNAQNQNLGILIQQRIASGGTELSLPLAANYF